MMRLCGLIPRLQLHQHQLKWSREDNRQANDLDGYSAGKANWTYALNVALLRVHR